MRSRLVSDAIRSGEAPVSPKAGAATVRQILNLIYSLHGFAMGPGFVKLVTKVWNLFRGKASSAMNSFGWSPSDCEGTSLILFVCAKRWMLWCDVMGKGKGENFVSTDGRAVRS
jgi:hypothetical protein